MIKSVIELPTLRVGDIIETENGTVWVVIGLLEITDEKFTDEPVISYKVICEEIVNKEKN